MSKHYLGTPIRALVTAVTALALLVAEIVLPVRSAMAAPRSGTAISALDSLRNAAPRVLTPRDAETYREIFAAQSSQNWEQADKLADQLNDRLLMGHVLYQRYLSSSYKSKFSELKAWLIHYADQPGADDIYKLARRKAGNEKARLPKPKQVPLVAGGGRDVDDSYPSATSAAWKRWKEGLAAWKAAEYGAAAKAFAPLARSRDLSGGMQAAAAYWAARAEQRLGDKQAATKWLESAAEQPTSFYGLLAAAALGQSTGLLLRAPTLSEATLNRLRRDPGVRRTIALVQVGRPHLAEREMEVVYARGVGGRPGALLALAVSLGLPRAQLRISSDIDAGASTIRASLYPLPFWAPTGGFRVDPAFLFALMRQESRFDVNAESRAGARGLMQIMPSTARIVATHHTDREKDALFNPIVNLTLGQRYIEILESDLGRHADPLTLAVAYNVGPTTLRKWQDKKAWRKDPLLFIETIPITETRIHTKRVLANFWIYCMRFDRDAVSLQAMADGKWPGPLPNRFPEQVQAIASNN